MGCIIPFSLNFSSCIFFKLIGEGGEGLHGHAVRVVAEKVEES